MRAWTLLRRFLFWLAAALLCPSASADVPVALFKSFAGNYNFTGTEVTLRTGATACSVYGANTALSKSLAGIPANSTVEAAYLYWAGSGSTADNSVVFDGTTYTAARKFTARYTTGGTNYDYFAGVADVTARVKARGNATYTFSGLTVSTKKPFCGVQGVMGGFALFVVYSNNNEPFRVLNVYEGFQNMRYNSIQLSLSNFKIPNPLGTATGRVGHITWEGDVDLAQNGEDLLFNGTQMVDTAGTMNKAGNQFDSQSNINGDTASYGIDFDAYTVGYPVIQADQTTATTVYSSGQDMVLLNMEVVAVPNVPVADLAISMTRTGEPSSGATVSYALSVKNNGPYPDPGPVTVTDTLPVGMSFVSASGTGWTCGASGQTVTCTYNQSAAYQAVLPTITLNATVLASGTGTYTNIAAVAGKAFDNVSSNSSASDTSTDPALSGAGIAITDRPCVAGVPISGNLSDSNCHRFSPHIAGSKQPAYITTLNSSGVPAVTIKSGKVTVTMSLTCVNPTTAGVNSTGAKVQGFYWTNNSSATPTKTTLPACTNSTTTAVWSGSIDLNFPTNSPSAVSVDGSAPLLQYPDVGLLQLNVNDGKGNISSARFISQPARLSFSSITRSRDQAPNPYNVISNRPGFAEVGEEFTVKIRADDATGAQTPNFGKETPVSQVTVGQGTAPSVDITNFSAPGSDGLAVGKLTYSAAGDIVLTPLMNSVMNDYMNSGTAVPGLAQTVGRFYPAYFKTAVTGKFDCQPLMNCPSGKGAGGEDLGVSGVAYSGQPFTATVTAYGRAGNQLSTFIGPYTINLSPMTLPGAAGTSAGTFDVTKSIGPLTGAGPYSAQLQFTTTPRYDYTKPDQPWAPPKAIYVRASAEETIVDAPPGTTKTVTISSLTPTTGVADEDGLEVVVGRMQVGNAFGSELLKLRVPVTAQYWTGSTWDNNLGDDSSAIVAASFTDCLGKFRDASKAAPNNCTGLSVAPGNPATLTGGTAGIYLSAPGKGMTGSGKMWLNDLPALPWLQSVGGRVVFGVNKSPVIYIREVY